MCRVINLSPAYEINLLAAYLGIINLLASYPYIITIVRFPRISDSQLHSSIQVFTADYNVLVHATIYGIPKEIPLWFTLLSETYLSPKKATPDFTGISYA